MENYLFDAKKNMLIPRAFFVVGTDTDVGKTTIACALLHLAKQQGLSTLATKPVASGCTSTIDGLRNNDALYLQAQCSENAPYELINPFAFKPAIAPHIAAAQSGINLSVSKLLTAVQAVIAKKADYTLIEGAGGWHVPINQHEHLSDLAQVLQIPIILIVGIKLGCINHTLLTVEAIKNTGVDIAGWIANQATPPTEAAQENIDYLRQSLAIPCLGVVPYLPSATTADIASYLHSSFFHS